MQMQDYLAEIEEAVGHVLPFVWQERDRAQRVREELARLEATTLAGYRQTESMLLDAEDADDVAEAAGRRWETYFGADKDRHEKSGELEAVKERARSREFSVGAIAGAVLQYAKQGISIVHGGLVKAPKGRMIGTQPLKVIIWQGRNQALHWEAGIFHEPVKRCFDTLGVEVNPIFAQYPQRNMSIDVVELLGWREPADFAADLISIA